MQVQAQERPNALIAGRVCTARVRFLETCCPGLAASPVLRLATGAVPHPASTRAAVSSDLSQCSLPGVRTPERLRTRDGRRETPPDEAPVLSSPRESALKLRLRGRL